jgi:hypothetical protein
MGLKFQHFFIFIFFGGFFENFSILEVEIGGNRPGILGVKDEAYTLIHEGWYILPPQKVG